MSNTTNTNVTAITTINSTVITLAIATRTLKTACDKSSEMALKIGTVLLAVKANKLWKEKYNSLLEFYNDFGISTSDASRKMQIVRKLYEETIDSETGEKMFVLKMASLADYNYSQLAEIARYTDDTMFIDLMNAINPEMTRNEIRAELNALIMARETEAEETEAEEKEETEERENIDETEEKEETEETDETEDENIGLIDIAQTISEKATALINKKRPTKTEKAWLTTFAEWVKTAKNLIEE